MCGICGLKGRNPNNIRVALNDMLKSLSHRGPNEKGEYLEDDLLGKTVFDHIHDEDLHDFKDSFTGSVENDFGFSCT